MSWLKELIALITVSIGLVLFLLNNATTSRIICDSTGWEFVCPTPTPTPTNTPTPHCLAHRNACNANRHTQSADEHAAANCCHGFGDYRHAAPAN